jgi:hypothetical protein
MATLPKKYDADEIGRHLAEARKSHPEPVSFDGYEIDQVQAILIGVVEFHREVPDADRRGIVWNAVVEAAKKPTVSGEVLRLALRNAESSYLRQSLEEYVVASNITLPLTTPRVARRVDGCTVTISPGLPKWFRRTDVSRELDRLTKIETSRFASVRVRLMARTDAAAVSKGLDAVDYLRACWNLRLNQPLLSRSTSPLPVPVNRIRIGPVYTLHTPSGKLRTERVWFDPPHEQHEGNERFSEPWSELEVIERWIRGRVDSSSYGDALKLLLVRYGRALDSANYELSFNRLWSVLEHLTGTIRADYDALIKRASFLYEDVRHARLVLEQLRDMRNGLVHQNYTRPRMELYLFQAKQFVEEMLLFHFRNSTRFRSLAEAAEYLAFPPDKELLARRAVLYRRAARFRS